MGRVAVVNENYWRVVQAARRDLHRSLTQNNNNAAPILLRLAFHDAANYDATTKQGGANGSVRFTQELNRPANNGIQNAVRFCEPIKRRYPDITYADLYQLAGIVAVEVTGGLTIDFIPGRTDTDVPDDDGIPNPNGGADHLRNVFYRMGLNDKDIVALSGAHALGGAHRDRSGFDGNFTRNPLKFDNSYFVELLRGDTPGLVKLPTDKVLVTDPRFCPLVELYARDQGAFFRDYAESHKKMAELGFNNYNHHQGSNNVYENNGGCTEQQDLDCAQAYVFGDYNGGCPGQYGYAAKPYANNNNGNGCCPVSGYYYNAC